ncbi:MAG: flagellar type III secretion system protein FlhB [Pseudomonadota bacterium]
MSGQENTEDDKQYEASQHKLDEARKKGDIPRSVDLNTSAAYAGLLLVGVSIGGGSLLAMGEAMTTLIARADTLSTDVFAMSGAPMAGQLLLAMGREVAPWFFVPAALVVLVILAQRGFVFAPSKLAFKSSRISPIAQAKNKFGRTGWFEFSKSFAKLLLYSVVLFLFLMNRLPDIMGAMAVSPGQMTVLLLRLCMAMMAIVFVIAVALGIIDFTWQRAEHLRKNRMSRKELTDEMKNSEGDPALKQQRRQKGMEIALNQMMADVPEADVIIVNPTHYAVALKWDRGSPGAPKCVAKGVDLVAARIREVAQENGVPIHSDPPTARALHAGVEIGQEIPVDHYKAVAAAIRFADKVKQAARRT